MPYKDPTQRNAKARQRYAEDAVFRDRAAARLLAWRQANPSKVTAQNKRAYRKHKTRDAARSHAYYVKNRDRMREAAGLPSATRECPAVCECCGKPQVKGVLERSRVLSLDHCHTTGKFRGWLCNRCNTAIGALGDSVPGLMRAVEYLQRSESCE